MYHVSIPRASGVITMLERSSPSWLNRFGDDRLVLVVVDVERVAVEQQRRRRSGGVVVGQVEAVGLVGGEELRVRAAARVLAARLLQHDALAEVLRRAEDAVVEAPRGGRVRLGDPALEVRDPHALAQVEQRTVREQAGLALLAPVGADGARPLLLRVEGRVERGGGAGLAAAGLGRARLSERDLLVRPGRSVGEPADRVKGHGPPAHVRDRAPRHVHLDRVLAEVHRLMADRHAPAAPVGDPAAGAPEGDERVGCGRVDPDTVGPSRAVAGPARVDRDGDGRRVRHLHRLEEGGDVQSRAARGHPQLAQVRGVVAVARRVGRVAVVAAGGGEGGAEHGRVRRRCRGPRRSRRRASRR